MIFTMFVFVTVKDMYLLLRNVTFKKIKKDLESLPIDFDNTSVDSGSTK